MRRQKTHRRLKVFDSDTGFGIIPHLSKGVFENLEIVKVSCSEMGK
jgi:hypothetical protein